MASFWEFVPALITAGATIWGSSKQADTQNKAAAQATQATQDSTAAQLEGIRVAEQNMQRQQAAASPGLVAQQAIIGRGDALTPVQQQAIVDARRTALDALGGGSLRGSARATAATVRDVEGRMTDDFINSNRNRVDQAATNLSGQYFNAGNNVANLNLATGKTASQGLMDVGNINAANTMGQGIIKGQAVGDIAAVIADQVKASNQQTRDSSYKPVETITWNKPGTERL